MRNITILPKIHPCNINIPKTHSITAVFNFCGIFPIKRIMVCILKEEQQDPKKPGDLLVFVLKAFQLLAQKHI